jgi:hypothetical protein
MGRHADETRHRGFARWLVAAVVAVVLLTAGTIAYIVIVNRDNSASAGGCTGSTVLPVIASTGAFAAVTEAAKDFDATAPVARSTCVSTSVTSLPGPTVATALADGWTISSSPPPTVWASDSMTDLVALEDQQPELTSGRDDEPLATSPVVLAVRPADAVAVEGLTWATLPTSVGGDGGVQLPSGDPLTLALPDPRTNRGTAYALESVLSTGTTAVSPATVAAGKSELATLAAGADQSVPDTATALEQLSAGAAPFNAVPVVESDLAAFNSTATDPLTAIYPGGGSAGDQLLATTLTGSWVDSTQSEAGAAFHAFLGKPAGVTALARGHVRVSGAPTPAVRGVTFTQPVTQVPAAEAGVADALALAIGGPAQGSGTAGTSPSATTTSDPASPTTTTATSVSTTPSGSPSRSTSTKPSTGRPTTSATSAPTTRSTPPTPTTTSRTTTSRTTTTPPALTGPVVTLLQDTSATWSTVVDGRSRLDFAQEGLRTAVTELAAGNAGLWTAGSNAGDAGYGTPVATAPVRDTVDGTAQSARLDTAIGGLTAGGTRTTYLAVVAAYQAASDGAVPGRSNRVLLITDGVDQSPGVSRDQVVSQLSAIRDQGKGVQLVILGVGESAPDAALTALAEAGGGPYTSVPLTPGLPEAIAAAVR